MKKYSEMNATERKAYHNFKCCAMQTIGELENTTYDYPHDSEDYKWAVDLLNDYDRLLERVYEDGTTAIYEKGFTCYNKRTVTLFMRDINFLGTSTLMELATKALDKVMEEEGVCIG